MAPKGKDTLKNLNKFLQDKGASKEESGEFLESKPKTLVQISRLEEELEANNKKVDQAFLVQAIFKLAEMENISPQEVLYETIEGVLGRMDTPEPGDVLLLSSVQYLAHQHRVDSRLQELLKD